MAKNVRPYKEPTHDEIAAFALRIYETEGRPQGRALDHWLQAEAQLIAERKAEAGQLPAPGPSPAKAATPATPMPQRPQTPAWQSPQRPAITNRN